MTDAMTRTLRNGIDTDAMAAIGEQVAADPANGLVRFTVATRWAGKTRTVSTVSGPVIAGETLDRHFEIVADEPAPFLGDDSAPNPQELLMAAVNACMAVGYVEAATMAGITLDTLEIETSGQLDLRGMLALDDAVAVGYEQLDYSVRIAGDGTPEQFEHIHREVMRLSPNYFNLARPVRMNGRLTIG